MKMRLSLFTFLVILIVSCSSEEKQPALSDFLQESPKIEGKEAYLNSPYVTAGNRVYMVGHQDGTFPDLGWHIKGEMGGIWNHPIKLMDGFDLELRVDTAVYPLNAADSFVNYPYANAHHFSFPEEGIEVKRLQFVPDDTEGILVQLEITNTSASKKEGVVIFTGHSDLRPTWLGERTEMKDGKDEARFDGELQAWIVKDSLNPWYVAFGSDGESTANPEGSTAQSTTGSSNSLNNSLAIAPGETKIINYTIAGSYESEESAATTYQNIQNDWPRLLQEKKERYTVLSQHSKLTIPDQKMQETFEWLKYNCDWLVRTVPELGTGIGAGIPDYPWYFGVDSEYALMGYMAIGQDDVVYNTIHLLDSVSNAVNGNGKIIHEMSTNGAVFNHGNINETPQFASLIWQIYQWNGDQKFLTKYFPTIEKGLNWLLKENDADGNGFPEGFGMMEIHGLDSEMIDVARIFLSSDGFQDQFGGPDDKKFLSRNFNKLLEETCSHPISDQRDLIEQAFYEWSKNTSQTDDVCVLGIEVR